MSDEATNRTSSKARKGAAKWSTIAAVILAGGLLYLSLRGTSWDSLSQILQRASLRHLTLTLFVIVIAHWIRSVRWRVLLPASSRVSVLTVFRAIIAGYLGNSFLPARAGELIRSAMLGRSTGLGTSFILATALSERLLDALTLVLVGLVAVSTFTALPNELRGALVLFGSIGMVGVVGLVLAPRFESTWLRLLAIFPLPSVLKCKLQEVLAKFLDGMRSCQSASQGLKFAGLTAVAWLTDAVGASLVARSIDLNLTIPQALFVLSALGLSSALPSTPGYVGVYQFVSVSILPLFDFTQEQALAFIVLAQAAGYVVLLICGMPLFRDVYRLWRGNHQSQASD